MSEYWFDFGHPIGLTNLANVTNVVEYKGSTLVEMTSGKHALTSFPFEDFKEWLMKGKGNEISPWEKV